ncbi:MAG: RNA-binding transcriptional accessory protein [Oscillospiraceae bacterium]|nr:RNA-binding transcriptional accessory protein [Oscillospiraceae bacterium]
MIQQLAQEMKIGVQQVQNTVDLIDQGNTIPFIARYRKEMTGSLDDQVLRELSERLTYLRNLEKRKDEVKASIESQGMLDEALCAAIDSAVTLAEVEDLYRPFRPKRRTRASAAKEKGLQPLADTLFAQEKQSPSPEELAADFIDPEKGVESVEDALAGASDIIAEMVSDSASLRKTLRNFLMMHGVLVTEAKDETDTVYTMYHDHSEPVAKIAPHRVLAIDRGEREEKLKVSLTADLDRCRKTISRDFVKEGTPCAELVRAAAYDGFSRLILPSLEREIRSTLTETAAEQAIRVFGVNLAQLLMQPPVKNTVTLGLDPAYRTGCKIAVIDPHGKVLDTTVIYPTPPQNKVAEAKAVLKKLIARHGVSTIAIGNGTASHESEVFVAELLREIPQKVSYMVVSEAGASVYSASRLAAQEFPQFDVSLRSAVSIARRLQDPLAELVKIDPKAIGVGQYQHDMPAARLDETLSGVVENCVNTVGVDVNSASFALLSHVAGISSAVAKNIVSHREENGPFQNRKDLLKVKGLGKKAFEQCAGFLRVPESGEMLDNTAVHPESYEAARALLRLTAADKKDLSAALEGLSDGDLRRLSEELAIGLPTLRDIVSELKKPGRDPRDELPAPLLRTDILSMEDLKPGMELKGTVRNVIDFGAFVDIGVHQDGLVHISQISDKFIKHPSEKVKVGDIVTVWVLSVDAKKKRISLTMKKPPEKQNP